MGRFLPDNPLPKTLTSWRRTERTLHLATLPVSPDVRTVNLGVNKANVSINPVPDRARPELVVSVRVRAFTQKGEKRALERAVQKLHVRATENDVSMDGSPRLTIRDRVALKMGRPALSLNGGLDVALTLPTEPRAVGKGIKVTASTDAGDITAARVRTSELNLSAPKGGIFTTETEGTISAHAGGNVTIVENDGSVIVETSDEVVVDCVTGPTVIVVGGREDVTLKDIISPSIRVDTTTGDQHLIDVEGHSVLTTTKRGNIMGNNITGSVDVRNNGGYTRLRNANLIDESSFTTTYGRVDIFLTDPPPDLRVSTDTPESEQYLTIGDFYSTIIFDHPTRQADTITYIPGSRANEHQ